MKHFKKSILLSVLILLYAVSALAKDPYWDQFRISKRKKPAYDISLDLNSIKPIAAMESYVFMGTGLTLGFHKEKKGLKYGVELGLWYFFGNEPEYHENEDRVTDFFAMIPLTLMGGYNFRVTNFLNIVPHVNLGASSDMLSYAEDGISAIGASDYTFRFQLHPIAMAGIDFQVEIFKKYMLQLGLSYGTIIEFSGFTLGQMVIANFGFIYKL